MPTFILKFTIFSINSNFHCVFKD